MEPTPTNAQAEAPGSRIDQYELLDVLGEGGFGTVWRARQHEPVRRDVALKIIKRGMDTAEVMARFDAERQTLALMDHPGIAQVYDAGATERGRPYFVMELVDGQLLHAWCDTQQLPIPERLALFRRICLAVQHAHGKGVVHRDLKPGNVLVVERDGEALPKVIDFGIAKATSTQNGLDTLLTQEGALIGTPAYMSPEQASDDAQVDTRSDVYSLGVMLYELLTGASPFDWGDIRKQGYGEVLRVLQEVDPPRPSTRLSTLRELAMPLAECRRLDAKALRRTLRGDLDWIVMRALEKDPERRYQTASELAADVQRHLSHEPVSAGPPGGAYRMSRFVRRNRGLVAAAGLLVVALVAGLVGTLHGLGEAENANLALTAANDDLGDANVALEQLNDELGHRNEQLDAARGELQDLVDALEQRSAELADQRDRARDAEALADVEAEAARLAASISDALNEFLTGDLLGAINPYALGRNVTLAEAIDAAADRLEQRFAHAPLVEAAARRTLAEAYSRLSETPKELLHIRRAAELYERELGPDAPETLGARLSLALVLIDAGENAEAERILDDVAQRAGDTLGFGNAFGVTSWAHLAGLRRVQGRLDESLSLFRKALAGEVLRNGPRSAQAITVRGSMALLLDDMGRYDEAVEEYEELIALNRARGGPDDPEALSNVNNLARVLSSMGEFVAAEALMREELPRARRVLGNDSMLTMLMAGSQAASLLQLGRVTEAAPLAEEAAAGLTRLQGPTHVNTLVVRRAAIDAIEAQGRIDEAMELYAQLQLEMDAALGPEHATSLSNLNAQATTLWQSGRPAEAIPLYEDLVERATAALGPRHPDTFIYTENLAGASLASGDPRRAWEQIQGVLVGRMEVLGDESPKVTHTLSNMAAIQEHLKDYAQALDLHTVVLDRRLTLHDGRAFDISESHDSRAYCLRRLGRWNEALDAHGEAWALAVETYGARHEYPRGLAAEAVVTLDTQADAEPDTDLFDLRELWLTRAEY